MTMCDSKEQLVSYLYDELDAAGREIFDQHLTSCAECHGEVAGLRSTREVLASWAPPEPDFGFRIVRGAAAPPAPPVRWFRPAWGLAAAAVLVLAAAAAVANVEVRYGQDGLVVRTGWTHGSPASGAASVAATAGPVPVGVTDLSAVERRLQDLEAASVVHARAVTRDTGSPSRSSDETLRRVRELLRQSEALQQQELALRVTALAREVDRRLAMVQLGLEGNSRAAVARDTQLVNNLRLIAQQK